MGFRFLGTGSAAPAKILTNDDLSTMVETSDEWITTRVGVRERHIAVTETTASLAETAARRALEQSGVTPAELDLILCATITADNICPTCAGAVQQAIGASCPAFDISSACSGFIFALETAAGFFARGQVKKALVIGAERISKLLDWTDRSTCVIFGDGAGAAVLEASEEDSYLVRYSGDPVQVARLDKLMEDVDPKPELCDELGIVTTTSKENGIFGWQEDHSHSVNCVHVAIGNNHQRGEVIHSTEHIDFDIFMPEVFVDGMRIIHDGVFEDELILFMGENE